MSTPGPDPADNEILAQATAELRERHASETSAFQKLVDRLTSLVGCPGFIAFLTSAIALWTGVNATLFVMHRPCLDPPPFLWMQGAIGIGALYTAALVLTTQRREGLLSGHRQELILELAISNDRKTSKIIQLIEEARRDNPLIDDRLDVMARSMSTPIDPHTVLAAIKDFQDQPQPAPGEPSQEAK